MPQIDPVTGELVEEPVAPSAPSAPVVQKPKRKLALRRIGQAAPTVQEEPKAPVPEASTGRKIAAAAVRGGSGILGGLLPAVGTAIAPGPGTIAGVAGGVAAGGLGELTGQAIEENVPVSEMPGKIMSYMTEPKRLKRAGLEGGMTVIPGKYFYKGGKVLQSGIKSGAIAGAGEAMRGYLNDKTFTENLPNMALAGGIGFATGGLMGRFLPSAEKIAGAPIQVPKPPAPATYADLMTHAGTDPAKFKAGLPHVMHKEGWGTNLDRILSEANKLDAAGNTDMGRALRETGIDQGHWDPKILQGEIDRLVAQGKPTQAMALAEAAVETRKGGNIAKWVAATRAREAAAAEKQRLIQAKTKLAETKLTTAQERLKKFRDAGAEPTEKANVSVSEIDPLTGEKITHTQTFKPKSADEDIDPSLVGGAPSSRPPSAPRLTPKEAAEAPPGGKAREVYDSWRAKGRNHKDAIDLVESGTVPREMSSAAPIVDNAVEGSVDDEAAKLRQMWGLPEPAGPKPARAKPVTPALVTRLEEVTQKLEASGQAHTPWGQKLIEAAKKVDALPPPASHQPQPYAPIVLEGEAAVGKAAQGAPETAKLMNPDMAPLPGAGGTKAVPEARDAVVEELEKKVGPQELNRRVGPNIAKAGGLRSTDPPMIEAPVIEPKATLSPLLKGKTPAVQPAAQVGPQLPEAIQKYIDGLDATGVQNQINAINKEADELIQSGVDEAGERIPQLNDILAALQQKAVLLGKGAVPTAVEAAKLPPVAPQVAEIADEATGRTSGPLKAARKRATSLVNEIKKTMEQHDLAVPGSPEQKLLARQEMQLQAALKDVTGKIGQLESALPKGVAAEIPQATAKAVVPSKVDPTQVMSNQEIQDIADSILNARTGEINAYEATAEWRAASKLYHTARAEGKSFVPDPRGTIDPATGEVALIPISSQKGSDAMSLGKLVAQVMPKELEAAGVIPPGFSGKVSKEIKEAVDAEARTRWQEGAGPPKSPLGSEGAEPIRVEPEGAAALPRRGPPVEVPPSGPAEGMQVERAMEEIPDVSPELSDMVTKFRQGVLDGTIPPDQARNTEAVLQREIISELAKKAGGGGTVLGSGFGGIQGLIERNPQFALKAALVAGGALTGAVTDPFDDPVLSAFLGAGAGMGGAKALQVLKGNGIDLLGHPEFGPILQAGGKKAKTVLSAVYQLAPHIQRANYLWSAPGLATNVVAGPIGAGFFGSLTKGLAGDKRGMGAAREFMNVGGWYKEWLTARDEATTLIKRAASGDPLVRSEIHGDIVDRILQGAGPAHAGRVYLQEPAIAMASGDIATRRILMRHGFSADEARAMTLTNEPQLPTIKKLLDLRRGARDVVGGPVMDLMFPFVRTPLNILDQGLQRFPIFGPMLQGSMEKAGYKQVTPFAEKVAQQGVSTAILFGSYYAGLMAPPGSESTWRRFATNASGQYSLIASLGFAMGQGSKKRNTGMVGSLASPEVRNVVEWAVPLPTTEPISNWMRFFSGSKSDQPLLDRAPAGALPAILKEARDSFSPVPIDPRKARRKLAMKRLKPQ